MEFIEGETLADRLEREKRISLDVFHRIFDAVLSGLDAAHQQGITHRDLKPSNIFLSQTDHAEEVRIIDFGIARADATTSGEETGKTITKTNAILGSPLYMSPEQCRSHKVDSLSDIYSIACVMFECLEGKPPFRGETAFDTMYKHFSEEVPALNSLNGVKGGEQLVKLIKQCLEKEPSQRPASAAELKSSLDAVFQNGLTEESKGILVWPGVVCLSCVVLAVCISAFYFIQTKKKVDTSTAKPLAGIRRESAQERILKSHLRQLRPALRRREASYKSALPSEKEQNGDAFMDACNKIGDAEVELSTYLSGKDATNMLKSTEADITNGLSCESASPSKKVILLCARGRCRLAAGNISAAGADFDEALSAASELWEPMSGQWIDVYIQRIAYLVADRKYAEAASCLDKLNSFWQKSQNPGRSTFEHTQYLYIEGPDRPSLLEAAFRRLKKHVPLNEDERMVQAKLALQFGQIFVLIQQNQVARESASLVFSLIEGLKDSSEKAKLKQKTLQFNFSIPR